MFRTTLKGLAALSHGVTRRSGVRVATPRFAQPTGRHYGWTIGSKAESVQSAEPAVVASDALAPLGAAPAGPLLTQLIAAPAHRRLARQWSDARPGGWNAQDASVAGALRIPVEELPQGFGGKDPQLQYTKESAEKRAIVVVPDAVDLSGPVEVLLHFHGQNIGYRERSKEGTVRDVEVDEIEQQIVAAGRNMVAVLPQGSRGAGLHMSKFTIGDPKTYVDDVLRLASAHVPRLTAGAVMKSGRLVMSGHSGGGPFAVAYAHYAQQPSSTEQEWVDAPPLLLFDGINGKDGAQDAAAEPRDLAGGGSELDHEGRRPGGVARPPRAEAPQHVGYRLRSDLPADERGPRQLADRSLREARGGA